ncbi:unnamed protein product [Urochloa decumbens]|uniref:DUF1618 domain-containing protein n=1 Tax=Urochloa decumbens TaxID=240449 RepID=A0ABC8ZUN3_9POAL
MAAAASSSASASSSSAASSAPARWGVLATIARVCASDDDLPPGQADLSLALAAPPGISVLTVPPRISPDPISMENFPAVLATDPSGLFLLHATQGPRTGPLMYGPNGFWWRRFVDAYFVCNARSATTFRLPDPEGNLGLVTQDGGRSFTVAGLQPIVGSDQAALLRYSSQTGQWTTEMLYYPLHGVRPWASHGVISQYSHSHLQQEQRLWWYDLSWGFLTCLSCEDEPDLDFVPLPPFKELPFISMAHYDIAMPEKPSVTVRSLKKPALRHGHRMVPWIGLHTCYQKESGEWLRRLDHEVCFDDIWSHRTYKALDLPKKIPNLAFVDPCSSDVVYFFLEDYIFGVDLCSASVCKCVPYTLDNPRPNLMSSKFVLPCKLF